MPDKIIIYGTDTWPFCKQARAAYGEMAIYFNVEKDPDKFDEMLTYSGGKAKVPVIVEGDKVTVGFVGNASVQGSISLSGVGWTVKRPSRWETINRWSQSAT